MIILPTEPLGSEGVMPNLLIEGDYGIGKSGLLASTGYLLADPEDKLKHYPDVLRVTLPNWEAHKDFRDALVKAPKDSYAGIGLDNLNVSYDHALRWVMKNVKIGGSFLNHPSENPQLGYPRVTHEFITWVREITLLGYHVIATCHVNIVEIRDKKGNLYNRWIPAFTGGSPTSTYSEILKIFSIVGYMTLDDVTLSKPPTRMVMGKKAIDTRVDASRTEELEVEQRRVIFFKQDPNFLANNKFNGFPERVVLTNNWRDNWEIIEEAWGTGEGHEVSEEPVEVKPTGKTAPIGSKAVGLK